MSIYSQINKNRWRTYLIFGLFILLTCGFFYIVGKTVDSGNSYLLIGIVFSITSTFGSYFFSDKIVLFSTGAQPADKKRFFDYYTVAENLSIASGIAMPKLYFIEDPAPNAFATGRNAKHAVICVTTGLLSKLNRAEIEGVVAHELSHIKNYDILLMSVVAVLVGTIALVSDWMTRRFLWGSFRGRDDNDRGSNPVFFIIAIVALIISPLIATIIQLAISRKREFLADADASLMTRYPEGLARALERISQDNSQLKSASTATAHLFISSPFREKKTANWLANLFSTHPPIEERVRILRSM